MVSNSILASLVVIVIVISVIGIVTVNNAINSITGAATGYANVTVGTTVAISLQVADVDFSTMQVSENNDTTDSSPPPFEVRNDGNVDVNVSVYATDLWNSTGYETPTPNYLGKCRDKDTNSCGAGSIETYTAIANTSNTTWYPITELRFPAAFDEAYFDINITVPPEEEPGARSSTVTFTGIQA